MRYFLFISFFLILTTICLNNSFAQSSLNSSTENTYTEKKEDISTNKEESNQTNWIIIAIVIIIAIIIIAYLISPKAGTAVLIGLCQLLECVCDIAS